MSRFAVLTTDFQIAIPKAVCEAHGWKAGQELMLTSKGDGVLVTPILEIDDLRGIAKGADMSNYRDRSDRY